MQTTIRPATLADSAAIRELAAQLGYAMLAEEMSARLAATLEDPNQDLLVAETAGQVTGWVYLLAGPDLLVGPAAEIGGLVVSQEQRGAGIGKALLQAAWEWATGKGFRELRVRSNTAREPYVKAFYLANGYEVVKTQWVFKRRRQTADGRPLQDG